MKKSFLIIAAMMGALFTACENGDWEFPDYKYSAVYFALIKSYTHDYIGRG